MKRINSKIISLFIFLLVLGACVPEKLISQQNEMMNMPEHNIMHSSNNAPVKEVHIDMFEWSFNQEPIVIKKGDHVKLIITSSQGTHGITIPDLDLSTGRISPGQEEILEFDATEAGTFDYYCNVPCGKGHKMMRGQLVIEP